MTIESLKNTGQFANFEIPEKDQAQNIMNSEFVSKDYREFMAEIGFGTLKNETFVIYSAPVEPDDIFDEQTAKEFIGIHLVGDDMGGLSLGFETKNDKVRLVEIDSVSMEIIPVEKTFIEWMMEMAN